MNANDLIQLNEKRQMSGGSTFKPEKDTTNLILLPSKNENDLPYLRASMAQIGGALFEFSFYKTHKEERRDPDNWYQTLIGTLFDDHPNEYREVSLKDRYVFQVVELGDDGKPVFDKTNETYVKTWKPSPGLGKVVEREIQKLATKGVFPFGLKGPVFTIVKDKNQSTGYPDYAKSVFGEEADITDIKVEVENNITDIKSLLRPNTRAETEFALRSYLEPKGINLVYRTIATGKDLAENVVNEEELDEYEQNLLSQVAE